MDLSRTLAPAAAFLDERGFRWALIGGLAMQAYGLSRATMDVEYLLRQPGVQPNDVRRYFEDAGLLRWFDELLRRV